jgi:hypothetical protein
MFRPSRPSLGGTHNIIYKEVIILTTGPLSVVQIARAHYLTNAVVVYLNVIARYLRMHAITSFYNISCYGCVFGRQQRGAS